MILVAVINVCYINWYFIFPGVFIVVMIILLFRYAREVIEKSKQLDLQKKSPIFQYYGETVNGLTQIGLFRQRETKIREFSELMN